MKKDEAEKLVNDTFTQSYDEIRFRRFTDNLFHDYDRLNEKPSTGQFIWEAFRGSVVSYQRLAKFEDPEGLEIDVLAVKLASRRMLENARTMQRNFVARYLNGSRGGNLKDAALVAFYSDDSDDWRFSLVRMDYVLDEEKQKVRKELTPARRFSFLVGRNENTHTARRQLLPVLQSDVETTLAELEQAFNIETVTKEFFEKYKGLYQRLNDALEGHLEKDTVTKADFESKNVVIADFAKRLLGQIVFLYFLQKKGWLGVEKGREWGSGPKDFLQALHRSEYGDYGNFFNDMLEPLFYEALATERSDNFYQRFNCRIPFLNGGLFEPLQGYDWVNTDILLDNGIFTEIFEVFDLYNFTVREDEPLDREVAVDPEMLGKVFENLIPENERKGSGTFYTPREIVHYMCQESLINYLDSKLNIESRLIEDADEPSLLPDTNKTDLLTKYEDVYAPIVPRDDVAEFIYHGDVAQEHDATAEVKTRNENYKGAYQHRIPETVRKYALEIDEALAHVKICDPAIGSGAFPVGIMNEIVRARQALNAYLGEDGRSPYDFKRNAIQESIYGVDIEPSAVDIAKLRLWLSLVVDEDDFGNIKPLPNLEYKIMAGDSLTAEISQKDMAYKGWLDELIALQKSIFGEYSPSRKQEIKDRIDVLLENLFQGHESDFRFNYWIQFYDVMNDGGFDIVIANPPYVSIEKFSGTKQQKNWKNTFSVFAARGDIYCLFYELGFKILKHHGDLCFITSNKFFRAGYGKKMRAYFTSNVCPRKIIDFQDLPVFDATAYPCISIVANTLPANNQKVLTVTIREKEEILNVREAVKCHGNVMSVSDLSIDGWSFISADEIQLMNKVKGTGRPLKEIPKYKILSGIKTGFNKAFVIDSEKREELISADSKSEELIKPYIRGKDLRRWRLIWKDVYIIAFPKGFHTNLKDYTAILSHLQKFEPELRKRGQCEGKIGSPGSKQHHWLELDNNPSSEYLSNLEKPKIVFADIAQKMRALIDKDGSYCDMTNFVIPDANPVLVGILNSSLFHWFFQNITSTIRGDYLRFKKQYVGQFPIANIDVDTSKDISILVQKIQDSKMENPHTDVSFLERRIDSIIYDLYDLTSEEISLIEESTQ